ncbi:hypothetical protein K469DRAFT_555983, partial [Zopfia rhizophila CBS 207.26]
VEKPPFTPKHIEDRVKWTRRHESWDFSMWKRVDWTDEMIIQARGFGNVYVTRTAEEKYESSCLVPKFRNCSSVMVHGSISGVLKSPLVVFKQE